MAAWSNCKNRCDYPDGCLCGTQCIMQKASALSRQAASRLVCRCMHLRHACIACWMHLKRAK
jgi:hypothetical protein